MSLVGSLEDLGLGDILQIISLSRKSGVLFLRCTQGEGRIVFQAGQVQGAFVKGGPADLRALVVGSGALDEAGFEAVRSAARGGGASLEELVMRHPAVGAERLETLRRVATENAVFEMFRWCAGEFSFEIREEAEAEREAGMLLASGISAQYLAMEATRLRDEAGARGEDDAGGLVLSGEDDAPSARPAAPPGPRAAESAFAEALDLVAAAAVGVEDAAEGELELEAEVEPEAEAEAEPELATDATATPEAVAIPETGPVAEADAELATEAAAEAEEAGATEAELVAAADPVTAPAAPADGAVADAAGASPSSLSGVAPDAIPAPAPRAAADAAPAVPEAEAAAAEPPAVVAIDRDLATLEWVKGALRSAFPRVHIFQRTELGIERIRQYLARGEAPIVVVSSRIAPDPWSGARDVAAVVERLKAQAPRTPVLALVQPGAGDATPPRVDGTIEGPRAAAHANPRLAPELEAAGRRLVQALRAWSGRAGPRRPARDPLAGASPDVGRLKVASARLRDPASRGEVLPLVMRFAAESFARVAIFLLRDDVAAGMAQIGLGRAGGPDDDALQRIALPAADSAWLRRVCESRAPVQGPPSDPGDLVLARALGTRAPAEAYLAPLLSGDRVVAVLYADNLPAEAPIGDTSALEVVLHEAGLALDRAVLERALAEADA